jgi:hypothetical protein
VSGITVAEFLGERDDRPTRFDLGADLLGAFGASSVARSPRALRGPAARDGHQLVDAARS